MTIDERWMQRALLLARRGKFTHPNPKVGAVLIQNGKNVGEGWHIRPGELHAEAMAFRMAGEAARGATMYVTLEPCAHTHREDGTPRLPCARRCIDAGIAHLVCAMEDPDPRVAGNGFEKLRAAGITVTIGPGAEQARALNHPYLKHRTTGLPWVLHKTAMTLDGKIATVSGSSKWITGEESRAYVHRALRNTVDAVVVGSGTVLADDPSLTTRIAGRGNVHQPIRVVIDSGLRTPVTAKVCGPGALLFAVDTETTQERSKAFVDTGTEVVLLPSGPEGHVDLMAVSRYLANERGALSVLLEAGGRLSAAFYAARLVDEVLFFIAPKLVGGSSAPSPIDGVGLASMMGDALQTGKMTVRRFGMDLALQADIIYDR